VSGKVVSHDTHRGRPSTVRRLDGGRVVAFDSGEGAPVTGGDDGVVLQHQGGREEVRRTTIWSHDARRGGSPRREMAMMLQRDFVEGRAAPVLGSGGGRRQRTRRVVVCSGADERETGRNGEHGGVGQFFKGAVARRNGEGVRCGAPHGERWRGGLVGGTARGRRSRAGGTMLGSAAADLWARAAQCRNLNPFKPVNGSNEFKFNLNPFKLNLI
jgi:hypothetical protein